MIASVSGKLLHIDMDGVVIDVGGIGFRVLVPAPVRDNMQPGEVVFLYTQLIVRQDALTLYGFETKESCDFFNLLLRVDGVGPRLALSVLSTLTPDTIRRAVFHEQAEIFNRVPGIGKKTSQKMLLYLQDRIKTVEGLEPMAMMTDIDSEVLAALTALGYSVVEAQAALQSIPRDAPKDDVEVRLRMALQYFGS
jgi:Holliday junction DNA helicase RuvA